MQAMLRLLAILLVLSAAAAIGRDSGVDAAGAQQPATDDVTVDVGRSPVKGSRSAAVAIIEYADFQCPYCAAFFRETWPALDSLYVKTGRVLFVFKHRPLPNLHPDAVMAATAAECAGEQGSFWPMHDLLFQTPQDLSRASLLQRAARLALDTQSFNACLELDSRRVRDDMAAATALRVTGTPTFLIGTLNGGRVQVRERLEGARPVLAFQAVMDRLLAEQR